MKRDTRAAWRRRQAATERSIDEAVAVVKAERAAQWAEAKAAAAVARANRRVYTADDLKGARLAKNGGEWREIARVNAKTVSLRIRPGSTCTDRVPFDRIDGVL